MKNKSPLRDENEKIIEEEVQRLMEERGRKALELAKKFIFEENIQSKEIREASRCFMEYWNDLARPSLISLCCEVVGGDPEITVPFGAAITIICGATDIHDDIIDKSIRKLSHLTIFGKFGRNVALLLGDYLLFKGFSILHRAYRTIHVKKAERVQSVLEKMLYEMGDGEALELKFQGNLDVDPQEYLSLAKMKAADIEACTRIGAILGNGSEEEIEALGRYGRMLGTIFILRDDLADSFDYEELSHRIKYEALPLPLILSLKNSETKDEMRTILKGKLRKKDMEIVSKLVHKSGVVKNINEIINELYSNAASSIRTINKNWELKLLLDAVTLL